MINRRRVGKKTGRGTWVSSKLQASSSQLRNQFHTAGVKNILISIWPEWQAGQIAAIAIGIPGHWKFLGKFLGSCQLSHRWAGPRGGGAAGRQQARTGCGPRRSR